MFIATVFDEQIIKKNGYALKNLAHDSAITLASIYDTKVIEGKTYHEAICLAEQIAKKIIDKTLNIPNSFSTIWRKNSSGNPINVSLKINELEHNTFWYRFLNITSFATPKVLSSANLKKMLEHTTITRKSSSADMKNLTGTYELTKENGKECIKNLKFDQSDTLQLKENEGFFIVSDESQQIKIENHFKDKCINKKTMMARGGQYLSTQIDFINISVHKYKQLAINDYATFIDHAQANNYNNWLSNNPLKTEASVSKIHYYLLYEDSVDQDFNDRIMEVKHSFTYNKEYSNIDEKVDLHAAVITNINCP